MKVAQLEAVAEMQQAELISYRKKFDSQQSQIDSLKAQIGNHEPQDGGALAGDGAERCTNTTAGSPGCRQTSVSQAQPSARER